MPLKANITAQKIDATFPAPVKAKLRAAWPTPHHPVFPGDAADDIICSRDGVVLVDTGPSWLDGCLPDLTIPRLLRMAEARGYYPEAVQSLLGTGEPVEDLWRVIKTKEGF